MGVVVNNGIAAMNHNLQRMSHAQNLGFMRTRRGTRQPGITPDRCLPQKKPRAPDFSEARDCGRAAGKPSFVHDRRLLRPLLLTGALGAADRWAVISLLPPLPTGWRGFV